MRRHIEFACHDATLIGTIDGDVTNITGLLIVSGGNELRSGAHGGMALLAQEIARSNIVVMRYDRRGIGDSSGDNLGYLHSREDIAAAINAFRAACPQLQRMIAFGNCDAASALALWTDDQQIDGLVLANPWVIEDNRTVDPAADPDADNTENPPLPPPSAVRSRYLAKLKDPRALRKLFSGQVDLAKLFKGLKQAGKATILSDSARQLGAALAHQPMPIEILLAEHDRTALAFDDAWKSRDYADARSNTGIIIRRLDSGSHSFASADDHAWLVTCLTQFYQHIATSR